VGGASCTGSWPSGLGLAWGGGSDGPRSARTVGAVWGHQRSYTAPTTPGPAPGGEPGVRAPRGGVGGREQRIRHNTRIGQGGEVRLGCCQRTRLIASVRPSVGVSCLATIGVSVFPEEVRAAVEVTAALLGGSRGFG